MSKHLVFVDVTCPRESKAAIGVSIVGVKDLIWIPQSQVHDDSEVYRAGSRGKLIITRWIAEQKGIEDWGEDYDE